MSLAPTSDERAALARLAIVNDDPRAERAELPLRTLDLTALSKTAAKPKDFAIERVAPVGEVTLLTGPGSSGKSLLAQQLATCAAAGQRCLGLNVQPAPAIYLTCEDDASQLHWRQEHICAALGVEMAALADRLHLVSRRGELENAIGVTIDPGNIDVGPRPVTTTLYGLLARMIQATGAKLVFLDNVAHLFDGNENDRGEVTQFVNLLNRLAGSTGAAIVLIGHPNKSGDSYSGSTAWLNAVRSQATLDMVRDDDGNVLDRDARVLSVGKANYAEGGEAVRFRWHEWAYVLDRELPDDMRAELAETAKATADNATFLRCLRARQEGREVGPSIGPNYAPARFAEMTEAKGLSKAKLAQAMERLFHIGAIETCQKKRKGNDTKTIIVEASEPASEPASESLPNTTSEPFRTAVRTLPNTHPIPEGITGAGPDGPPPPDEGGER